METLKAWYYEHKRLSMIIVLIFVLIVAGSVARCNAVQNEKAVEQEKIDSQEPHAEFTSLQQQLYNDYETKQKNVIDFMTNSKWVDNTGKKALFLTDRDILERYNNEENLESYAICSLEEEKSKVSDTLVQYIYRMTVVNSKNDYKNLTLTKVTESESSTAGVLSANLESQDLFSNATIYNRVYNTDNFQLANWDNNANQFINNEYDALYKCIRDYCAKYYPQVSNAEWTNLVTIDYQGKTVQFPFLIKTTSTTTLNVIYYQDKDMFECTKAKNS